MQFLNFYFRIITRFYRDGHFEKGLKLESNGKPKPNYLSYWDTVPSFLFFAFSFVPLIWYPTIRMMYLQSLVLGSILGYSWLAFKSVCWSSFIAQYWTTKNNRQAIFWVGQRLHWIHFNSIDLIRDRGPNLSYLQKELDYLLKLKLKTSGRVVPLKCIVELCNVEV